MRIKRYSIVILFLFVSLYIKATGQSCDVIYINLACIATGRNSKVIVCQSDFFLYTNQRKHADKHQDDTAGYYCTGDSCENPRAFFSIIKRVVAGLHAVFNENMFVGGIIVVAGFPVFIIVHIYW